MPGRKRQYQDNAERQRAYRERKARNARLFTPDLYLNQQICDLQEKNNVLYKTIGRMTFHVSQVRDLFEDDEIFKEVYDQLTKVLEIAHDI